MTESVTNDDGQASRRDWATLRLTTGFYLGQIVTTAMSLCDSRVSNMAVRNVRNLLQAGCKDEHQWREAIDTLAELCRSHPDAHKASGTWYDGSPTLLAQAAAMEAAQVALYKLYPELHQNGEIEGATYKAFKYLLRAMAQRPDTAAKCLQWVEDVLNLWQPV